MEGRSKSSSRSNRSNPTYFRTASSGEDLRRGLERSARLNYLNGLNERPEKRLSDFDSACFKLLADFEVAALHGQLGFVVELFAPLAERIAEPGHLRPELG